jgi:hypothetical protein
MIAIRWFFILSLFLWSCRENKNDFIKVDTGLQYQVFPTGYGDTVQLGQYLKLRVRQVFNDSVLSDSDSTLPQYQVLDSAQLSKDAYAIFRGVRIGDSLIFKVPADSAFKAKRPNFARKGGWLYTYVKVQDILRSEAEAQADLEGEKQKRRGSPTPGDGVPGQAP